MGVAGRPALARVEVPLWLIEDHDALGLLQAILVEQSAQTGSQPYPYPLIRAHETAVVKLDEHRQVDQLLQKALLGQQMAPALNSNKQHHKQHKGRGRME